MRLHKNKKGQVRVIEAFFASILLLSCLTLVPTQTPQYPQNSNLAQKAQNVFLSLDSNGHLASLIDAHDWAGLQKSVAAALPLTVWFNLTVCDNQMRPLNAYPICNGGQVSDTVSSVTYVCASQNSTYAVYVLMLQLAGVD
jgi:hypothetical protein